jgi:hypothetical protein
LTYKPALLPPNLRLDATVAEVMAFRRESARTVFRKIGSGGYTSYKSGENRLILWDSAYADRERCLARGPQLSRRAATGKRPRGRPRKDRATATEPDASPTA